jgi:hypothetical protein
MKTFGQIIPPQELTRATKIQHFVERFGTIRDDRYEEAALEELDDAWQAVDNAADVLITLCSPNVSEELLALVSLLHRCGVLNQQMRQYECAEEIRQRAQQITGEVVWIAQERDRVLTACALETPCLWQLTELASHLRRIHKEMHAVMCEMSPAFNERMKPTHRQAAVRRVNNKSTSNVRVR